MQLCYIPTNIFTLRHVKGFHVLLSMLYLILSFYNFFNKLWMLIKKNSKTIMLFVYFDHKIDHKTFTFRLKWQMSPLIRKQKTKTIISPMKNTPVDWNKCFLSEGHNRMAANTEGKINIKTEDICHWYEEGMWKSALGMTWTWCQSASCLSDSFWCCVSIHLSNVKSQIFHKRAGGIFCQTVEKINKLMEWEVSTG